MGTRQFVVFRLGNEEYGFDVAAVREIHKVDSITTVHRSAPYIEGVMNLRGKLVTVVNLRKRFGMQPMDDPRTSRIIVVDAPDAPVGFLVDEVVEVSRFAKQDIEKAPAYVTRGIDAEYVSGIAKQDTRLVTIIDPLKVLELTPGPEGRAGGAGSG
jgi:purine-binding chemotaxis protein CheW